MRRIVVSTFVTLDGVVEGPGHDEHRDGKNAWALKAMTDDMQRYKFEEAFAFEAMLLGRVTYQIFAAFWPTAPGDQDFARRMNTMPKYVASSTMTRGDWANTTILGPNAEDEVAELKQQPGGDIVVYGSPTLVDALLEHDLVDEVRLMVFPVVLGSGQRLFAEGRDTTHMTLVDRRTFESGVVLLVYQPSDEAPAAPYADEFAWTEEQIQSYQAAQNADRVLATVLFTDIVDSTGRAAELGDEQWRRLLDRHDRAARAEVERFRGHFVKSLGDGILATFDAPTRALRCAFGLTARSAGLGLPIRAAIHTGEIEIRDEDVGGIGVHIASRALGEAPDGGVVVTRTVRDLATGTDLGFRSLGTVGLRGVPGDWELFEASAG